MKFAIQSSFHAKFAISQSNYTQTAGDASAGDVASEALGAAKQVVAEAPATSGKALISFRAKVHESASIVRQTVSNRDDIAEVDDAVKKVDAGLDALEADSARNQVSTSSVLEVDTRSKQRSTIKIRTQEGDVVRLSLRQSSRTSASDIAVADGDKSSSETEIKISSRSRLSLRVKGDLNEGELTAIKNVFAQAESIANEFFQGDIAAAFELASGVEFDSEQLARVNLRFRSYQSSSVSYTESIRALPPVKDADLPAQAPAVSKSAVTPADSPETSSQTPAQAEKTGPVVEPQAELPASTTVAPIDTSSAISDFFSLLSGFLRSVGEGFETVGGSQGSSLRFHYSESFKLTLLNAVVNAVEPEDGEKAGAVASAVVDELAA